MSHRLASAFFCSCLVAALALLVSCGAPDGTADAPAAAPPAASGAGTDLPRTHAPEPDERHFGPLTMLTDGGNNAEAYFAFGGDRLVMQSTVPPYECDQIFAIPVEGGEPELVSTGRGRTTCGYFLPGDDAIVYSSTHAAGDACPETPDRSAGYVWPIYASYDIVRTDLATGALTVLTDAPGYDAEATVSPNGDRIVFTSTRDGDLDIYSMALDGSDVKRLTDGVGYDGGPFFSPDGTKIVYRARYPETEEEKSGYLELLGQGLVRPGELDIWVMNADGSGKRQVTDLPGASFAPFFHPSGQKIIFSSNHHDPQGREFDLFIVNLDGSGLEQVTHSPGFDGFPMFSPDGTRFVFASNRHNSAPRETNVFVTEWRD